MATVPGGVVRKVGPTLPRPPARRQAWDRNPRGGTYGSTPDSKDTLAERLRRRPAKPMGSPRVGSNPTGVVWQWRGKCWSDLSGHTSRYRSHFGSRYKLGCCSHASLLAAVRIPRICELGNDFRPNLHWTCRVCKGGMQTFTPRAWAFVNA